MKRRSVLIGAVALTLSQLVVGCRSKKALRIRLLKNSVPAQLIEKFRREIKPSPTLQVTPQLQLNDLFVQLQTWKQKSTLSNTDRAENQADLVMLGDYWLGKAIEQKLIRPLNPKNLKNWSQLPPQWQALVRRNERGRPDPQGQIWAAPYRWGPISIAYRVDKFESLGWKPTDWSDLWREELRDRISLIDSPRVIIGLILKKLGKSYNTENINSIPNLKNEFLRLHQQVKLYSLDAYLQPLLLGDTWLAVGWSTDILPLTQTKREIAAIVPKAGTALWADLWVQPQSDRESNKPEEKSVNSASKETLNVSLAEEWINFCWHPDMVAQLSLLVQASSPLISNLKPETLSKAVLSNPLLLPEAEILAKSEFLLPLSNPTIEQYRVLWTEVRKLRRDTGGPFPV